MHELSVAEAIAGAVNRHADGRPVTSVLVRIGHLRQVVPDALTFSWQMITTGSELEELFRDGVAEAAARPAGHDDRPHVTHRPAP